MNEIALQWFEDYEYRDRLMEKLHEAFARGKRTGTHVSDIVYCLHKAWYHGQEDHEQDLTSDSILYFVRGRSLGDMLEKLFDEQEFVVNYEGVIGHIDAIDTENHTVIEIKTAKSIWNDKPSEAYQTQLRYYMTMYNTQIGYLFYYVLSTNQLRVFKFIATPEQLEETRKEIAAKKKLLDTALAFNDVTILPMSKKSSFECRVCDCDKCPNYRRKN